MGHERQANHSITCWLEEAMNRVLELFMKVAEDDHKAVEYFKSVNTEDAGSEHDSTYRIYEGRAEANDGIVEALTRILTRRWFPAFKMEDLYTPTLDPKNTPPLDHQKFYSALARPCLLLPSDIAVIYTLLWELKKHASVLTLEDALDQIDLSDEEFGPILKRLNMVAKGQKE